ncbi:hypothetical protein RB653_004762 [Dictyostelium firmibasis]|uniref:Uncharacterized protein n=1 Tax=Dictyostelium firmibasis TaxID=79012 RepID=A0AAN7YXL5_9MYCE
MNNSCENFITPTTTKTTTTINNITESVEELKNNFEEVKQRFYSEEEEEEEEEEKDEKQKKEERDEILKIIEHESKCILRLRILLTECEKLKRRASSLKSQVDEESSFSLIQSELIKTIEKNTEIKRLMNNNPNNKTFVINTLALKD